MLRHGQHSRKDWPASAGLAAGDEGGASRRDARVPMLTEALDRLDLHAFLHDRDYRRRLSVLLDSFSAEEFDDFERHYIRRRTLN